MYIIAWGRYDVDTSKGMCNLMSRSRCTMWFMHKGRYKEGGISIRTYVDSLSWHALDGVEIADFYLYEW